MHEPNSYFESFAGIADALDALAKAITPDPSDDGTPPEEGEKPCCNSYFSSFGNIRDALVRVREAMVERIEDLAEKDPDFAAWKASQTIPLGKGANAAANGVAVGWNANAGMGTGSGASDSGAVAVGKGASAVGIDAVALGRNAVAGTSGSKTTKATVQLGSGTNTADGTLQFRTWRLVDATGKVPRDRLPDDAGGLVESTVSYGVAADRTNGLLYCIFKPSALGFTDEKIVLKRLGIVTHTSTPDSSLKRIQIRTADLGTVLATSDAKAFSVAGATVTFTLDTPVELDAGTRYAVRIVDSSGYDSTAPVMLANNSGGSPDLITRMTGRTYETTDFFPCITLTTLKAAPDIASVIAEAKIAIDGMGCLDLKSPTASGGTVALSNRAVNSVTLTGSQVAFSFPTAISGRGRAFVLRITMSSSTNWTLPSGVTFEGESDVFDAVQAGETAVFIFSEMTAGRFLVSRKTVSTVTK